MVHRYLSGQRRDVMRGRPTRVPYTRPAINTLERLHAELCGQILENRQKHQELSEQMRHVEARIKLLDPGYNLAGITVKRRKPNKWFKRGQLYRKALDVLRTAAEPMTATEIGAAVLKTHGVEDASKDDVRSIALASSTASRTMKGKAWSGLARLVRPNGG